MRLWMWWRGCSGVDEVVVDMMATEEHNFFSKILIGKVSKNQTLNIASWT